MAWRLFNDGSSMQQPTAWSLLLPHSWANPVWLGAVCAATPGSLDEPGSPGYEGDKGCLRREWHSRNTKVGWWRDGDLTRAAPCSNPRHELRRDSKDGKSCADVSNPRARTFPYQERVSPKLRSGLRLRLRAWRTSGAALLVPSSLALGCDVRSTRGHYLALYLTN